MQERYDVGAKLPKYRVGDIVYLKQNSAGREIKKTLMLFIFTCNHIYNVCLLHDFVATLRLSALPSVLYFVLSKLAL